MWCMVVLLLLFLSVSLCGCWYTYRWSLFNSDTAQQFCSSEPSEQSATWKSLAVESKGIKSKQKNRPPLHQNTN